MSTGYTIGGDTWYNTYWGKPGGQTFRVPEECYLNFVKVYVHKPSLEEGTRIIIKAADGSHEPFGPVLAAAPITSDDFPAGVNQAWIQKTLSVPVHALPAEYFVILLESMSPWLNQGKWQYDANDATYPAGRRIHSEDGGATWIQHPNDDHMFYIWGTPPGIPPPPSPPPDKWAPLSISQQHVAGGFIITLITDVPCHLWLLWTDKEPWTHRTTAPKRGLNLPWDSYWCFVSWNQIEQAESGDTTTHTFTWLGWEVCQTKYFTFHGQIGNTNVKSGAPIFKKHYSFVPPPTCPKDLTEYTAETTTCNGRAGYQLFTPGANMKVTAVKLPLRRRFGSVPKLRCRLYPATPAGLPVCSTILGEGILLFPSPMSTTWAWYTFPLTPVPTLIANTPYTISLEAPDSPCWGNQASWRRGNQPLNLTQHAGYCIDITVCDCAWFYLQAHTFEIICAPP